MSCYGRYGNNDKVSLNSGIDVLEDLTIRRHSRLTDSLLNDDDDGDVVSGGCVLARETSFCLRVTKNPRLQVSIATHTHSSIPKRVQQRLSENLISHTTIHVISLERYGKTFVVTFEGYFW